MDRSFWCMHDHITTFAVLGIPTLVASMSLAAAVAILVRNWTLDPFLTYILWAIVVPVSTLSIATFLPLPCAVFAWFQACGENKSAGECYAWCLNRAGRLFWVMLRLFFYYICWFLFWGLPMLVFWPRTCLAPDVALFENQSRIFSRSRKLMREDSAIHLLAGLYLLLALVLGALITLPRLLLLSNLLKANWTTIVAEWIWVLELTSAVLLVCGLAVSWCVSLALFYHDLRHYREGEGFRKKLDALEQKYAVAGGRA